MAEAHNDRALARRDNVGGDGVLAAAYRLTRGPRARLGIGLWAFGLVAMLALPAPYRASVSDREAYKAEMQVAEVTAPPYEEAMAALREADARLGDVEVFFWRFREPYKRLVPKRRKDRDLALRAFRDAEAVRNKALAKARGKLGLWSDAGVTEARDSFWKSFESGKVFATRQSFWDGFFALLGGASRDEHIVSFIARWAFMALANFSVGMIMAVLVFCWRLPALISSFDAGFFSGTLFFTVCAIGAIAVVITYLALLTGAAAGTVYVAATTAGVNNLRLGGGRGPRRGGYVRYHAHRA